MYFALIVSLLAVGLALGLVGLRRRRWLLVGAGVAVAVGTLVAFGLLSFWGEKLWFEAVGYESRFWTAVLARLGVGAAGALLGAVFVGLAALPARSRVRGLFWLGPALGALAGLVAGVSQWDVVLRWWMRVPTELRDPILGNEVGFYLFTLPLLDGVYGLLLTCSLLAIGLAAVAMAFPRVVARGEEGGVVTPLRAGQRVVDLRPGYTAVGALLLVLAFGRLLGVWRLLLSRSGIVHGPGWTDVHVRLPALYVAAAALALAGLALIIPPVTRALERFVSRRGARSTESLGFGVIGLPVAVAGGVWAVGLVVLPLLFQWLKVTPNELALERPYLVHNIAFTRSGFALDRVEEREVDMQGHITPEIVEANDHLLSEVRLWDPGALQSVLEQFQEIRLYYELTGLDVDRYTLDGRYRQVMVAPREMETGNLPQESQTFVNRRFKYTHGYGLTMAPVSDFTPDGLPNLVIRNLPPVSTVEGLEVEQPAIYYGERTDGYVIADTDAPEFDYPAGDSNVYVHYAGKGGVPMGSTFRRFLFGWKLGGTRLFFSDYPNEQSRILFHRDVRERVATVAPFLELDEDPYVVLVGGRLKWIVDAYTTSSYYPYSEAYFARPTETTQVPRTAQARGRYADVASSLRGANYVRNSVKAVVDAYDGDVTLYVFEPEDPIVQVWARIFPGLFQPEQAMPPALRDHVRYPEGLLQAQGLVFAKYHMDDPEVFYNQEDLWVRATEKYYGDLRPVEPYYVMWHPPGGADAEFVLMQPYTPKNRQVLIGWIAGMCDGENYGRLLAYRFPKDKWVLGPQQVDTKIDQDPHLSGQLSLWDQRGSRVIRGNVLAIPIEETILYVEPIYLQAEAAAYPELRVVVTMSGDDMTYAPTFGEALEALVSGADTAALARAAEAVTGEVPTLSEAAQRATRAFEAYQRFTGEGRFPEAAEQLRALGEALEVMREGGPVPPVR